MKTLIIVIFCIFAVLLFFSIIIALVHKAFGDRDDPTTPNANYYKD